MHVEGRIICPDSYTLTAKPPDLWAWNIHLFTIGDNSHRHPSPHSLYQQVGQVCTGENKHTNVHTFHCIMYKLEKFAQRVFLVAEWATFIFTFWRKIINTGNFLVRKKENLSFVCFLSYWTSLQSISKNLEYYFRYCADTGEYSKRLPHLFHDLAPFP